MQSIEEKKKNVKNNTEKNLESKKNSVLKSDSKYEISEEREKELEEMVEAAMSGFRSKLWFAAKLIENLDFKKIDNLVKEKDLVCKEVEKEKK